jgi:hypothetical protein
MSGWHEDNFLENLMPPLRRKLGAELDPCPDADTLSAVIEGAAADWLKEVVAGHLTRCEACAGLHDRLLSFERGGLPGHEGEWADTQKRLDNWMAGFLASEAARPAGSAAASRRRPHLSHVGRWRLTWVAGLAAAALLAATVVLMRRDSSVPRPAHTEARATIPRIPPPHPAPVEMPALKAAKPAKAARKHISPLPIPVEEQPAPKSVESGATEQAANVAEPPAQPTVTTAPGGTSGASRAVGSVPGMSRTHLPFQSLQSTPTQPTPASLRIEAGTAIWIRLNSVSRQAGGSFTFRGSLLLPVANVILLDQGTLVYGSGAVSQGQTSLLIREFVMRGARYTLSNVGSSAGGGTGKTVQFDAGQVLELFLASASIYEQAHN